MRRRGKQLELGFAKRASARRGDKVARAVAAPAKNALLPHVAREAHDAAHPVHVTMRRVATGPSFRAQRVCAAIREVIGAAKRNGVRVLHYSVQDNHLHFMVEGASKADLANQMRTLFSRIAFAVNAVARRHGKLFRDRHHRHDLKNPREVRNALVYILFNDRKHAGVSASAGRGPARRMAKPTLDPCSSAWWFEGWSEEDRPPIDPTITAPDSPLSRPRTWLARWGWHRGRASLRLRFSEMPRPA